MIHHFVPSSLSRRCWRSRDYFARKMLHRNGIRSLLSPRLGFVTVSFRSDEPSRIAINERTTAIFSSAWRHFSRYGGGPDGERENLKSYLTERRLGGKKQKSEKHKSKLTLRLLFSFYSRRPRSADHWRIIADTDTRVFHSQAYRGIIFDVLVNFFCHCVY